MKSLATILQQRIQSRDAVFGVIGLGYVGLPLATGFAAKGVRTIGFDVSQSVADRLNSGDSHIKDVDSSVIEDVRSRELFEATTDMTRLAECDVISICVPTPLSKTRDPDMTYVQAATESVSKSIRPGQLVILESTTYPGTTREVILPNLQSHGMKVDEDFFLAFSPERIDPGNPDYGIFNTAKVVGGLGDHATELAASFYRIAIEEVHTVSTPEAAEMVKLHENTFRAVNIALANETALMCDRLGINVWEVIDAAATKPFGFMPFYPGPGIGGHCIPLDPHYLSWKMRTLNYRARFIELASEINSSMPEYWVDRLAEALNDVGKPIKGSRILVVGVAYKPDIDDTRESPALDIIALLQQRGADVTYHDPYVATLMVGDQEMASTPISAERLSGLDAGIVVTNHASVDNDPIIEAVPVFLNTRETGPRNSIS